jgi:hypothetical protein
VGSIGPPYIAAPGGPADGPASPWPAPDVALCADEPAGPPYPPCCACCAPCCACCAAAIMDTAGEPKGTGCACCPCCAGCAGCALAAPRAASLEPLCSSRSPDATPAVADPVRACRARRGTARAQLCQDTQRVCWTRTCQGHSSVCCAQLPAQRGPPSPGQLHAALDSRRAQTSLSNVWAARSTLCIDTN